MSEKNIDDMKKNLNILLGATLLILEEAKIEILIRPSVEKDTLRARWVAIASKDGFKSSIYESDDPVTAMLKAADPLMTTQGEKDEREENNSSRMAPTSH